MCNAACIDEAINRVHIEMRILSESTDISAIIVSKSVFHVLNDFSHVLSVSRGLRLWETSRIFCAILSVSWGMLNSTTSGSCTSFLPGPHLRVCRTLLGFHGYSKIFLPQTRRVARRDHMLLLSLLVKQAKSFPEIFSTFQTAFLRKKKDGCRKSGCRKIWCRSWC